MNTRLLNCSGAYDDFICEAAEIIRNGGLVAFPTETVYGLGANGLDPDAVNSIFRAKGRPNDNPLILHVSDIASAEKLWSCIPDAAYALMNTFWPGPLTIIAPRASIVPDEVTAGLETVAVRLPSDPVARALISKAGVPIAAPSANLSGKPSPTTAEHVFEDMKGKIPIILDGGPCKFGVESTVVTLAGEVPTILRPGAVTLEMLSAVIGEVKVSESVLSPLKPGEKVASPGMKYKHYSPEAEVFVVNGSPEATAKRIMQLYDDAINGGKHPLICATEETMPFYNRCGENVLNSGYQCAIVGTRKYPQTMCTNLFRILRDADSCSDLIFAEGTREQNEGLAYMNRLLRAAGFKVIEAGE